MKQPKLVSLASEIEELRSALRGVQILADELAHNHLETEYDERAVPSVISAIAALVDARAKQVSRVLRHEEDPASIWNRGNAVTAAAKDTEVVLAQWSHARGRRTR